jgi:hypothetical protein
VRSCELFVERIESVKSVQSVAYQAPTGDVQKAQRRAAIGTALRHSGHFFVVGSGGASPRRILAIKAFTGSTTKT